MTKTIADGLAAYRSDADLRAAKMRLGPAMPDRGWLHDYLHAVTPLTDAPPEFHLISGMAALSAAIGNRLFTESWGQNVFPHLWAVLVAPSSFWRKSTSISQAERMLYGASDGGIVYPSDWSREKLISMLAEQPAGFMAQKEFGGFLELLARNYMAGAKEMLTDLYDGPDTYTRALKSEVVKISRPAITLLGATTLNWLESKITDGDLQGGFLARFLFVTASAKASPKGMTPPMAPDVRARLQLFLHDLHEAPETQATFSPDATEALNDWTLGWEEEVGRTHHRSDLSGFAVRLQTYALKFAMLYRLSAVFGTKDVARFHLVDVAAVEQAIAYCRALWTSVAGLIDDDIAITKDARDLRRLKAIIGSGITRSDALKRAKLKARDFDAFLDTLVGSGEIQRVKARASELGIDRLRDTTVEWLAPGVGASSSSNGSLAGHDLAVPVTPSEPEGEPEEGWNPREPEGPDLSSGTLSTSLSPSLSITHPSQHDSLGRRTRAGEAQRDDVEDVL